MMKFTLIAEGNEPQVFKLTTQADSEKELEVVRELTNALISKITKIKVCIGYEGEE